MSNFFDEDTGEFHDSGSQMASIPQASMGIARAPDGGGVLEMMVHAAQGLVRDQKTMITRAKQIGGLLAGDGFYSFPTGGSTVSGPSIDMAEALAQEWGAMMYRVSIVDSQEMASGGRRIHLRASVADLKSLVCAEVDQVIATSPPPGKFAKSGEQSERWHAMQSQSASSKIVRNAILRILPSWYVEPAFQEAQYQNSQRQLKGKSLPEARKGAIDALAEFKIALDELEAYTGQPAEMWAVPQLSILRALFKALKNGEQSIEAWRAGLNAKNGASEAPKRSALGLPAQTDAVNAADALKAKPAAKEPAKKETAAQPAVTAQRAREPGEDEDPDFTKTH